MSLFWPIVWIGSILAALIAFAVIAMREKSIARAATIARQPKNLSVSDADETPGESMEGLDSFPSDNFEFEDGTMKS